MARSSAMSVPVARGRAAPAILLAWAVLGAASVPAHAHTHVLDRASLLDPVPRTWVETRGRSQAVLPSQPDARLLAATDHPRGLPPREARPARVPGDSRFSVDESSPDERHGAGVPWEALSEGQRELLSKYQAHWDQLPMGRQRALARGAQHWLTLPPEQREKAQRRFEHWQSLDPGQRRELRRRYQEFKVLPEQEQERIRRGFHDFQHLTPEQRREMRKRFHELSPEERRRLKEGWQREQEAEHGDHPPREYSGEDHDGRHGPWDHPRHLPRQGDPPPERAPVQPAR